MQRWHSLDDKQRFSLSTPRPHAVIASAAKQSRASAARNNDEIASALRASQ
jgi:hypothetical protein